jgi:hypothetical protein
MGRPAHVFRPHGWAAAAANRRRCATLLSPWLHQGCDLVLDKPLHQRGRRRFEHADPTGVGEQQQSGGVGENVDQQHARFLLMCVRADRRSAIKSHGLSVRDALIQEWYNGREALIADGVAGAARFRDGLGRHGDFTKIR